jgi:parallel beta-helix repeat protein
VASNSIARCGQHGILLDNHDGAAITGNTVEDAWLSAIAIGHAVGVHVAGNTIVDANVAHGNGQAGVYLHATTSGCVVRDNSVVALLQPSVPTAIDRGAPGANTVQ